ncbi:MAG TPA: acyltransferase [Lysobacter sp.]
MNLDTTFRAQAPTISATVPTERLLPGIHALRGIAAVAVVLFHLGHLTQVSLPSLLAFVQADFAKGVYLFFVLSAFSLMHSTERHVGLPNWTLVFFIKRFWRIAPLFYAVLCVMVAWQIFARGQFDLAQIVLNLTFATASAPWEGIVPAGWTVGVEMLFYAMFPVLLLTVRSTRAAWILSVIAVAITCASRVVLFRREGDWANAMFAPNLCFFAFGLLAYRIVHNANWGIAARRAAGVLAVAMMLALFGLDAGSPLRQGATLGTVFWGIAFLALCIWLGAGASGHGSRTLHYLGERSYSIYLMHPLVLWLLRSRIESVYAFLTPRLGDLAAWLACACLVLVTLLLVCEGTYRLIELPGIRVGARINRWLIARG